jgi:hypothetical protein
MKVKSYKPPKYYVMSKDYSYGEMFCVYVCRQGVLRQHLFNQPEFAELLRTSLSEKFISSISSSPYYNKPRTDAAPRERDLY